MSKKESVDASVSSAKVYMRPTTELACQKIRDLRRAYREREVLDEGGGE